MVGIQQQAFFIARAEGLGLYGMEEYFDYERSSVV